MFACNLTTGHKNPAFNKCKLCDYFEKKIGINRDFGVCRSKFGIYRHFFENLGHFSGFLSLGLKVINHVILCYYDQ